MDISDLTVEFDTPEGTVRAVDHVSYSVDAGETLAVVGETGCGKSVTVLAALGLLGAGRIVSGAVTFGGADLLDMPAKKRRRLLGHDLTMVFQNPMTALNPVMTVGRQVAETLLVHEPKMSRGTARDRAIELLAMVGVPQPDVRYNQYPHEFSGGMCQRVVIAMAIANKPRLIVADEPTTAVDVTIQAQLLDLLRVAREETGAAVVMITHDLGVVAEVAERVAVMYAGRVVEMAPVEQIFRSPRHPYTVGLLSCLPRLDRDVSELIPIPGAPPDLRDVARGCPFEPRCEMSAARSACQNTRPPLMPADPNSVSACHFVDEVESWARARRGNVEEAA
nr:ABC transporter ATP-binding protein [Planosporangium thailandense]